MVRMDLGRAERCRGESCGRRVGGALLGGNEGIWSVCGGERRGVRRLGWMRPLGILSCLYCVFGMFWFVYQYCLWCLEGCSYTNKLIPFWPKYFLRIIVGFPSRNNDDDSTRVGDWRSHLFHFWKFGVPQLRHLSSSPHSPCNHCPHRLNFYSLKVPPSYLRLPGYCALTPLAPPLRLCRDLLSRTTSSSREERHCFAVTATIRRF